jgi:hypothetical protein
MHLFFILVNIILLNYENFLKGKWRITFRIRPPRRQSAGDAGPGCLVALRRGLAL